MSYRTRVLVLGALVALPLLVLAIAGAVRDQMARERALNEERVAIARAAAAGVEGFLEGDIAALHAMVALSAVRAFQTTDGETLDRALTPVFGAFPNLETIGLIGPDGWNVRSLTRHVPVPPRTVNVSDRPYFRAAIDEGLLVVSPAVLSRVRPGVPVVAVAVPIMAPSGEGPPAVRGVLVGTLSLARLQAAMRSALPDPRMAVILVDSDGRALVAPDVDPASTRELISLRGRADVDAVLGGGTGSLHVMSSEELLTSFAPVADVGWGVLVQQPVDLALAPARTEAVRSVGLLFLALAFSFLMAWFLSSRLARSYQQLQAARWEAERGHERSTFLAESSGELARTLDYDGTLQSIARLAVPALADWCVVDLVGDPSDLPSGTRRLAVAHADPAKAPIAAALREQSPPDVRGETAAARVIRTSQPLLHTQVTDALLDAEARDEEHRALLRQIAPQSAMVVPLRGRNGIVGTLSFVAAESGRRYSADDLQLALELADRAVLAVESARLYGEVQHALHTRDEFLAAASHDLKNPLALVKLQMQLLSRRARRTGDVPAAEAVELAERVDGVVTRAAELVEELLDVARIQLDQPLDLVRDHVDLTSLVAEVVGEVQAGAEQHRLHTTAPEDPLVGEWDGRRLRRVVDNLLGNAVKYSPEGGEIVIALVHRQDGDVSHAVLTIRDHGIGIPEDDLPRIFERFRRGTNVIGRISGTGIGLASARYIVESHGGTITIDSEVGRGTQVVVVLPMEAVPVAETV